MQESFSKLKAGTRAMTRYVAEPVVHDLMKNAAPTVPLDMKMRHLTILFTDLEGYGRKRIYKLTTRQGKTLVATANHPLRTLKGWTDLGNLKAGDRIAAVEQLELAVEHEMHRETVAAVGSASWGSTQTEYFEASSNGPPADLFWDTVAFIEPQGDRGYL